ncbi:signal peptidase II [Pseudoscardovia suis]
MFIAVIAVCVILDRVSKLAALRYLADGRRVSVLGNVLGLKLLFNPGASLGMGSGATPAIALLACAACILLCVAAWRTESMAWTVALALCCAGALGNLIDRVYYATGVLNGKVVDFIDYGWSIGNVADVELFVAAVVVVVLVLADVPYAARRKKPADDGDGGDVMLDGSHADFPQREGGAA